VLLVAGEKLWDMDIMSHSDPMCVLYTKIHNSWVELGRTEEIKGTGTGIYFPNSVAKFLGLEQCCRGLGKNSDIVGYRTDLAITVRFGLLRCVRHKKNRIIEIQVSFFLKQGLENIMLFFESFLANLIKISLRFFLNCAPFATLA
jgi:hypothetical protein